MPTLFASTLPKLLEPPLKPGLFQRTCKANAEKKLFLKNFLTFQKNKKRNAQLNMQIPVI
jgi:hypothetical protein